MRRLNSEIESFRRQEEAAAQARQLARNFELSLKVPIYFQDERLTSHEAEESLRATGYAESKIREHVDSQAAAIILRDFIVNHSSAES